MLHCCLAACTPATDWEARGSRLASTGKLGTSAAWVASVSTVCSPLRGCTLPFAWGLDVDAQPRGGGAEQACCVGGGGAAATDSKRPRPLPPSPAGLCLFSSPRLFSVVHSLCICCAPLLKAQLAWPWLKGLYDFRVDQWHEHASWSRILTMHHPFWQNGDNTLIDATPTASAFDLRAARPHLSSLLLVSVTCDTLRSGGGVRPMQLYTPSKTAKLAAAAVAAAAAHCVLRHRRRLYAGLIATLKRVLLAVLARTDARDSFIRRQTARNLTLAALAALLRHRALRQLASPRLAAAVALGTAAVVTGTAAAAAGAATVLGIPFRLPSGGAEGHEDWRSALLPLRPLLERTRPLLHAYLLPWLVKPALRLNSAAIHRTAALLQGELRVTFTSDNNDGLVDLPSHLGLDSTTQPAKRLESHKRLGHADGSGSRPAAERPTGLRSVASAGNLTAHRVPSGGDLSPCRPRRGGGAAAPPGAPGERSKSEPSGGGEGGEAGTTAGEGVAAAAEEEAEEAAEDEVEVEACSYVDALMSAAQRGGGSPRPKRSLSEAGRNFSHSAMTNLADLATSISSVAGEGAPGDEAPVWLERGRWHILRVPGADHSLGTWASDKSDEMYTSLFELLDANAARR